MVCVTWPRHPITFIFGPKGIRFELSYCRIRFGHGSSDIAKACRGAQRGGARARRERKSCRRNAFPPPTDTDGHQITHSIINDPPNPAVIPDVFISRGEEPDWKSPVIFNPPLYLSRRRRNVNVEGDGTNWVLASHEYYPVRFMGRRTFPSTRTAVPEHRGCLSGHKANAECSLIIPDGKLPINHENGGPASSAFSGCSPLGSPVPTPPFRHAKTRKLQQANRMHLNHTTRILSVHLSLTYHILTVNRTETNVKRIFQLIAIECPYLKLVI